VRRSPPPIPTDLPSNCQNPNRGRVSRPLGSRITGRDAAGLPRAPSGYLFRSRLPVEVCSCSSEGTRAEQELDSDSGHEQLSDAVHSVHPPEPPMRNSRDRNRTREFVASVARRQPSSKDVLLAADRRWTAPEQVIQPREVFVGPDSPEPRDGRRKTWQAHGWEGTTPRPLEPGGEPRSGAKERMR
jgi:hypothetical protein